MANSVCESYVEQSDRTLEDCQMSEAPGDASRVFTAKLPKKGDGLRVRLARVAILKAQGHNDQTRVEKKRKPMSLGTPARGAPAQKLLRRLPAIRVSQRKESKPAISHDGPPTEVMWSFFDFFRKSAHKDAELLSYALADYVHKQKMLAGYSDTIVAAACIEVAACTLDSDILRPDAALKEIQFHAVRSALNSLWLQRRKQMIIYQR